MFCPLCKAEFRPGFNECSDCHVALVATEEEAQSVGVIRLWEGDRQAKFEGVLAALDQAGIPFRPKEIVNRTLRISLLGIPLTPPRSTFEYEVWVFSADLEKAQQAIQASN